MPEILIASGSIVVFIIAFHVLKIPALGKIAILNSFQSLETICSKSLKESEKEKALQKNFFKLVGYFFLLLTTSILCLVASYLFIFSFEIFQLTTRGAVFTILSNLVFLIITTVVVILFYWIWLSMPSRKPEASTNNYTPMEQFIHEVAFTTWSAQSFLAGYEDRWFRSKIENIEISKPIFITALPRAGTTLLLELLSKSPELATHTYRDMPFVNIPLIWTKYSKYFKKDSETRERAHGDGMMINEDSPEALEEVLWKTYWAKKYTKDIITPFKPKPKKGFEEFFQSHMKKIIAMRHPESTEQVRYISKNNLNIARLDLLTTVSPDALIIIPFRHPIDHAQSLLRQHLNFTKQHEEDSFSELYMNEIGHFDFGKNLKPINFNNWCDNFTEKNPAKLNFWIEYWINAYTYLQENAKENIEFLCYETFCKAPEQSMKKIREFLDLKQFEFNNNELTNVRPPKDIELDGLDVDEDLLNRSLELYKVLQEKDLFS